MEITSIVVKKIKNDGPMKAVATVTFDNCFAVHDLKVIVTAEKTFVVMPARKDGGLKYKDVAHPINQEFRQYLEGAVLDVYYNQPDPEDEAPAD